MKPGENEFFDINTLPTEEGVMLLGVSMSRIGNSQGPAACFEHLKTVVSKIQHTEGLGVVTWYGDYLYFHSKEPAHVLRDRYVSLMLGHRNAFMSLLRKDRKWTHKAFSFITFGQLLLNNAEVFNNAFDVVSNMYKEDPVFKNAVDEDCRRAGKEAGELGASFILEEITMLYLAQKGALLLNNTFVTDAEKKWVLQCYPGKPLKSEVYLFQKNPLNLSNPKNRYENCYYDVAGKVLYDYTRLNVDTFDFAG